VLRSNFLRQAFFSPITALSFSFGFFFRKVVNFI
jgi:hypothetical protein